MDTMQLIFENTMTGPLRHRHTRHALVNAVGNAVSLNEVASVVNKIAGLASYLGGSHVAVHPTFRGQFAHGSERVAIIVASAPRICEACD